jgi:hypothetical protein
LGANQKDGEISKAVAKELANAISAAASGVSGSKMAREPACRKAIALALKGLDAASEAGSPAKARRL